MDDDILSSAQIELRSILRNMFLKDVPNSRRPLIATELVQLMATERYLEEIESSPPLSHIVEDIAADLEWQNGNPDELWYALTDAVRDYLRDDQLTAPDAGFTG